jgi:hypothetical protein
MGEADGKGPVAGAGEAMAARGESRWPPQASVVRSSTTPILGAGSWTVLAACPSSLGTVLRCAGGLFGSPNGRVEPEASGG